MENISILPLQQEGIPSPLLSIYSEAFALPPYCESFSAKQAQEALKFVLEQKCGQLLCAIDDNGQFLGLSGGYLDESTYIIEELAVAPDYQGKGIGRALLKSLLNQAQQVEPSSFQLRTNIDNRRSISLYQKEGFRSTGASIMVPALRTNGQYSLDERIYLAKPEPNPEDGPDSLKRVSVAYPSGNTTAIVWDKLALKNSSDLNSAIMKTWRLQEPEKPEIEQCCFVKTPQDPKALARVEMFGGEFCGNATRSVIFLLSNGQDNQGLIEVSGANKPLRFTLRDKLVDLEMPTPTKPFIFKTDIGTLVRLEGITQLVIGPANNNLREILASLISTNAYNLGLEPAVGISSYDPDSKQAKFCVYVKAVNTTFDETACGSGTCAIGLAQAFENQQDVQLDIFQPSNEVISTQARIENGLYLSNIKGGVNILYDGKYKLQK